jgi:hypothetical protein
MWQVCDRYVAGMWQVCGRFEQGYQLIENFGEKVCRKLLRRHRRRIEDNIKVDLKKWLGRRIGGNGAIPPVPHMPSRLVQQQLYLTKNAQPEVVKSDNSSFYVVTSVI